MSDVARREAERKLEAADRAVDAAVDEFRRWDRTVAELREVAEKAAEAARIAAAERDAAKEARTDAREYLSVARAQKAEALAAFLTLEARYSL